MPRQLAAGDTLGGRYIIERLLASGGMASVYLARDIQLDQEFAIKVISTNLASDPTFVERFRREGRLLARLNHPNILRFFTSGAEQGTELYYMVLEYLTGGTLRERLGREQWRRDDVVELLRPVADALDYAHTRPEPVIHRDLKPGNIMFDDRGRPVVSDFGLARLVTPVDQDPSGSQALSLTAHQVIGTPSYMAPEQAEGLTTTAAADVYALGVVAYQMLVGDVPFRAETPLGTLARVISQPVPPPSRANPAVSRELEQALFKALAKKPADRFATASDFVEAIAAAPVRGAITRRVWGPSPTAEHKSPVTPALQPTGSVTPPTAFTPPFTPPAAQAHTPITPPPLRATPSLPVGRWLAAATRAVMSALAAVGRAFSGLYYGLTGSGRAMVASLLAVARAVGAGLSALGGAMVGTVETGRLRLVAGGGALVAGANRVRDVVLPSPRVAAGEGIVLVVLLVGFYLASLPRPQPVPPSIQPTSAADVHADQPLPSSPTQQPIVATVPPTVRPVAAPPTSTAVPPTPAIAALTATAAESPTAARSPTAVAERAQLWQNVLTDLGPVWDTDWPASIELLDTFLARFPDDQPAKDKLYVALTAYGADLVQAGQSDEAVQQYLRAADMLPDRPEAIEALNALTPTPIDVAGAATPNPIARPQPTAQPRQPSQNPPLAQVEPTLQSQSEATPPPVVAEVPSEPAVTLPTEPPAAPPTEPSVELAPVVPQQTQPPVIPVASPNAVVGDQARALGLPDTGPRPGSALSSALNQALADSDSR